MQVAHVIHDSVAVLFVAASFGHINIGTIGAEGTFEGMWRGRVDAVWAKQHQDLWYGEENGGTRRTEWIVMCSANIIYKKSRTGQPLSTGVVCPFFTTFQA
jgi:cytochrome b subunit of formate dehydrogenase